jgi:hypothetical protein
MVVANVSLDMAHRLSKSVLFDGSSKDSLLHVSHPWPQMDNTWSRESPALSGTGEAFPERGWTCVAMLM